MPSSWRYVVYKIFYNNATDAWNNAWPNEIIRKKSERFLSNLPAVLFLNNQCFANDSLRLAPPFMPYITAIWVPIKLQYRQIYK